MSSRPDSSPALSGELYKLPFASSVQRERARSLFADLIDDHDPGDVLVLKRFPTGIEEIGAALSDAAASATKPTVHGLTAHARTVLEELPATPRILQPAEQGVLLAAFLEDYEWETPYLRQAAQKESFVADIGRFVSEATWQGSDIESDDPVLAELATFKNDFHDWLAEHGLLDPANTLATATDALADPERRERVQREFDAVLVLEFEEFTRIDRRYLAELTADVRLVCLAERHSAIQRTWNEPGTIEEYAPGLDVQPAPETTEPSGPTRIATQLAAGEEPGDAPAPDQPQDAVVIEERTFADQIRSVADEIERLRRDEGIRYDDCAVVLRDANAPIPETLRLLQNAGIPVSSATVGGLEHDPAARELYALVSWCCDRAHLAPNEALGWEDDRARAVLEARVPSLDDQLLDEVRLLGADEGLHRALARWCVETDLKGRIAGDRSALEAKTQFGNVEDILGLAAFVDDTALVAADWTTFCDRLEKEMQRASSDRIATELDMPEEGVLVDAARVLKNEQRDVVFLVNVVDRDYPADPQFTALFPTPHIEQLTDYPAYTTPDEGDVRATFPTAGDLTARPLRAYYAELSRRLLAVGARAADERLYFATYREDTGGTGSNLQPSRFLTAVEESVGELDRIDHDGLYSHGAAVEFALNQVDETLQAIRRAGLAGEPIDLDRTAEEFATVQKILENEPPEELPEAVRARVDFARGAVRRE